MPNLQAEAKKVAFDVMERERGSESPSILNSPAKKGISSHPSSPITSTAAIDLRLSKSTNFTGIRDFAGGNEGGSPLKRSMVNTTNCIDDVDGASTPREPDAPKIVPLRTDSVDLVNHILGWPGRSDSKGSSQRPTSSSDRSNSVVRSPSINSLASTDSSKQGKAAGGGKRRSSKSHESVK